ncbi:MAG: FlgD immunoglobulin-like domain containing protein [bacterium]
MRLFLVTLLMGVVSGAAWAAPADHLILAEIQTLNNEDPRRPLASEYIEIVNPTASVIDLSEVYLTDAIYAPGNQFYWRIAEGTPTQETAGGGAFADFHARFPSGAVIAPGDTIVIAVSGGSGKYNAAYGKLPDFELYEDGTSPDQVPELVEAFPGSIAADLGLGGNSPTLSDSYESLILFEWDGSSDLVTDLDFAFWGSSASYSSQFDKTGVTVGGSTYVADTPVPGQQAITATTLITGQSYMRHSADEGAETVAGGNGVTGHDETSEDLGTTWQLAASRDPASQPPYFFPTAPIITAHSSTPSAPFDGQEVTLSVTAVSYSALSGVTFLVAFDRGPFNPITGTSAGGGVYTADLPGKPEGTHVAWYAVAASSNGREDVTPAWGENSPYEWTVAAEPLPGEGPDKLLLTEICTLGFEQEFLEISNPNAFDVDMSDYYLTDAIYTPGNQVYWRIAEGNPSDLTVGGGNFQDFHARFPAGFMLAAGDTIVVTCPGSSAFFNSYGFLPDLELYEDDSQADDVPDMLPVWGDGTTNSIIGPMSTPALTNGGESLVLYHWGEGYDLVTDIDVFTWKDPVYPGTTYFFDKTGVTIGSSTYDPDTAIQNQHPFGSQLAFGQSYIRIDPTEGSQIPTGSNGVDGRDETSEDFNATFAMLPSDPAGRIPVIRDLAVVMQPHAVYVVIPSTGGGFFYDVTIGNLTDAPITIDVDLTAMLPTGTEYPVTSVTGVTIPALGTVRRLSLIQRVPAAAPGGIYTYRCVATPQGSVDPYESAFNFEKSYLGAMGEPVDDWFFSGWEDHGGDPIPPAVRLEAAVPNPFNPQTTLTFELSRDEAVHLDVYDLAGRHIRELVRGGVLPAGMHQAIWDGRDHRGHQVAAGLYVFRLRAGGEVLTRRAVMVK